MVWCHWCGLVKSMASAPQSKQVKSGAAGFAPHLFPLVSNGLDAATGVAKQAARLHLVLRRAAGRRERHAPAVDGVRKVSQMLLFVHRRAHAPVGSTR